MDKKTLELILNAVFDAAEVLLKGKPILLYTVKAARVVLMQVLGKLVQEVNVRLPDEVVARLKAAKRR